MTSFSNLSMASNAATMSATAGTTPHATKGSVQADNDQPGVNRDTTPDRGDFRNKLDALKADAQAPAESAQARREATRPNAPDAPTPAPNSAAARAEVTRQITGEPLPAERQELPADDAEPIAPAPAKEAPTPDTQAANAATAATAVPTEMPLDNRPRTRPDANPRHAEPTARPTAEPAADWQANTSRDGVTNPRQLAEFGARQNADAVRLNDPGNTESGTAKGFELSFPTVGNAPGQGAASSNPALAALAATDTAHATATSTASTAAGGSGPLPTRLDLNGNSDVWARSLAGQVQQMIQHGPREMTLRLNPAELGHLQIRVHMERDVTTLAVTSQHAAVKELIEAGLPQLRQNLQADGLNLGDVKCDVNEQLADPSAFGDGRNASDDAQGRQSAQPRAHAIDPEVDARLRDAVERVAGSDGGRIDYLA